MKNIFLAKTLFYISIFNGLYFFLAFNGVIQKLNSPIVNALFELITIPLIILQLIIFLLSLYKQFVNAKQTSFFLIGTILISLLIFVFLFITK
ncbi:hypothetical protein BCL90_2296 [Pedobacter alluvionis]|uniref:Uncharacterized protein n=1 Tax=Pedobacter alluvionis TaxID=475253 RepID=A0A497Y531_9SPHI|nr:hypothetical protein BCL90_2296 [Pedobacter alluvionis]